MTQEQKTAIKHHSISVSLAVVIVAQACVGTWWLRGQEARITEVERRGLETDTAIKAAAQTEAQAREQRAEVMARLREIAVELRMLRDDVNRGRKLHTGE
jgi:hypothetical protein